MFSSPLFVQHLLVTLRVSPERPKVKKGRPWERADDHFLMYFCSLFESLWGILMSRTLGKKFYPGFLWKYLPLASVYQKQSHMKKGLLPNFAQRDFSPFLIPPSKDSCFWCGFTILPLWKCFTIKSPSGQAGSLGGSISGKHPTDPQERTRSGTKFPLRSSRCEGWMYSQIHWARKKGKLVA